MSVPDVTADPSEIKQKSEKGKKNTCTQKKRKKTTTKRDNKKSSFPILCRGYRNIAAR